MGDSKENLRRSFAVKGAREEGIRSLAGMQEVEFHGEEINENETPHGLHLNMEITKEEFEILYTRL